MAITPEERERIQHQKEIDDILRWFQYGHLPDGLLQEVSKQFAILALQLVERVSYHEQVKLGLYDLLRAKDCFVRAALAHREHGTRPMDVSPFRIRDDENIGEQMKQFDPKSHHDI